MKKCPFDFTRRVPKFILWLFFTEIYQPPKTVPPQGWAKASTTLWPVIGWSCRSTEHCGWDSKEHHHKDHGKGSMSFFHIITSHHLSHDFSVAVLPSYCSTLWKMLATTLLVTWPWESQPYPFGLAWILFLRRFWADIFSLYHIK